MCDTEHALCVQAIKRMQQEPTEAELMIVSPSLLFRQGPCLCVITKVLTKRALNLESECLLATTRAAAGPFAC